MQVFIISLLLFLHGHFLVLVDEPEVLCIELGVSQLSSNHLDLVVRFKTIHDAGELLLLGSEAFHGEHFQVLQALGDVSDLIVCLQDVILDLVDLGLDGFALLEGLYYL